MTAKPRTGPEAFARWLDITMDNTQTSGNNLARKIGVNISQVSRWRHGHTLPTLEYITAIARAFNVDPHRLGVLSGRIPASMAKAEPLTTPEPRARLERVRTALDGVRGLTPSQRNAMLRAFMKTIKENR